jgi:hypothetical protein
VKILNKEKELKNIFIQICILDFSIYFYGQEEEDYFVWFCNRDQKELILIALKFI